jgi:Mrp family chromosome partitioning ATPase
VSGADFLPSGGGEPNALGLLMSTTMVRVLQTLRHDYDLVLLDTPPAEAITDARVIAGLADARCSLYAGAPPRAPPPCMPWNFWRRRTPPWSVRP